MSDRLRFRKLGSVLCPSTEESESVRKSHNDISHKKESGIIFMLFLVGLGFLIWEAALCRDLHVTHARA